METTPQWPFVRDDERTSRSVRPADVLVGTSTVAVAAAVVVARRARPFVQPLARGVLSPPLLPSRLWPRRWLETLGRRGAEQRASSRREVARLLDALVPVLVEAVVQRADLTSMVTRYVDLDGVVAQVDLDAAAAGLDIDSVARRLDLEAVLDRVDLTELVLERVDLDAIARRIDLDAVLDRVDLTAVVLERVDLGALVDAVLARIDLVGLTEEVIDAVDLPGIIRESTGTMASDTVRGARMQGIAADEAVSRVRNRLLLRRSHRPPAATEPGQVAGDQPVPPAVPPQTDRYR